MALISVEDALERALSGIALLDIERVPIAEAHGRVLAEDLAATLTQPPFDCSAMDGYAVRAADVSALPATLALVGESAAGARFDGMVRPGQAVRIFTGAPVPDGADTVVMQENTEVFGESVLVNAAAPVRHIRPRGQDFMEGDVLLRRGTRFGARTVMLAAAMNCAELRVRRKPRVAILSTGDEIMPPGSILGADKIVASVIYGLGAFVDAQGGESYSLGIARDDERDLAGAIARAADADVLVTIGGASVGERDLVRGALARAGLQLSFAKVAMRPGKPVFAGMLGSTRVLGLPGNPVSAFICSMVFLLPMLHGLLGTNAAIVPQQAVLASALPENGPRQNYQRATSTFACDGTRYVRVLSSQDSSLMAALAHADCLIVQPPHSRALPAETKVLVLPLVG